MKGKGFHLQHATPRHTLCSSRMQGEGYTVVPFPFPVHRVTASTHHVKDSPSHHHSTHRF